MSRKHSDSLALIEAFFAEDNQNYISHCKTVISKQRIFDPVHEDNLSTQHRLAANKCYKKREFDQARHLYNLSVKVAGEGSEEITLAYASRSALNYELSLHMQAVHDVDSALQTGKYPVDRLKKLYMRKINSLCKYYCLEAVFHETYTTEQLAETITLVENEIEVIRQRSNLITQPYLSRETAALESATSCVELRKSPTAGRFIQAATDIPAGSVVIAEDPYVAVLLPKCYKTKCYNCLLDSNTPVYCRRRCGVQFCSLKCSAEAWSDYHRFECAYALTIVNTGIGQLAYRIICATPYNTLLEYKKNNPVVLSDKYHAIYNLVTNSEQQLPGDKDKYTEVNFFPSDVKELTHEDAVNVGALLLHHIQQLICNAHAITELRQKLSSNQLVSTAQEKTATAVYTTTSMLNHSCKPNVVCSFEGKRVIIKVGVDVKAGEEILNCYGPHYVRMSKKERQEVLNSQYYFQCKCAACENDEKLAPSMALECPKCKGPATFSVDDSAKCHKCQYEYNCYSQMRAVMKIKSLLKNAEGWTGSFEKLLSDLREALMMSDSVMYKDSLDRANLYDWIARCYAYNGEYQLSAENIQTSVSMLERLYGKLSVEVGNELQKLAEVLYEGGRLQEALSCARKARLVLSLFFSNAHMCVRELDALCAKLETDLRPRGSARAR